jgi:hypothetical protein
VSFAPSAGCVRLLFAQKGRARGCGHLPARPGPIRSHRHGIIFDAGEVFGEAISSAVPGIDWTNRYPTIAAAVAALACRSCLIDGEVVICGEDGVPVFDRRVRRQQQPRMTGRPVATHWMWTPTFCTTSVALQTPGTAAVPTAPDCCPESKLL